MQLVIAARKSDLARLQAYSVGEQLLHKWPNLKIQYLFKSSFGDRNQDVPLWQMPEKGAFTEDFIEDLREARVDCVVHSWKDLPAEERPDTEIIATLRREDPRDLLLFKKSSWPLRKDRRVQILSSSPRRVHNLGSFLREIFPDSVEVEFEPVRGNIPTRLRKWRDSDSDGLVVAKAAMDRLLSSSVEEFKPVQQELRSYMQDQLFAVLPLSENPTAAAQGALAIEIRRGDARVRELFEAINEPEHFADVQAERESLKGWGGGCHQKIGITHFRAPEFKVIFQRGETDQGECLDQVRLEEFDKEQAPRPPSPQACWPHDLKENKDFFERRAVAPDEVLKRLVEHGQNQRGGFWISRAEALPENFEIPEARWVWCAGVPSWKKLLARGLWVHGCSDSLGETRPEIDALAGEKGDAPLQWLKLTHREATHLTEFPALATYELIPRRSEPPDWQGCTHFFWSSGSLFLRALELAPELRQAWHFCGPGNSYREIVQALGSAERVFRITGWSEWRMKYISKGRS